ncbi:MAG: arginase [Candidatus Latescibacteria bacterium]|nr:arginase [Candidatus Latescibacterota bacterium]
MKPIRVIGAPQDLGAGRRGVDMGPSALRIARINSQLLELGRSQYDAGNIVVSIQETQGSGNENARYLHQIADLCTRLSADVTRSLSEGEMPLILGGDHSVAIGTIAGAASHFQKHGERMGLIWVDAHADMNTPETTPSGNIHGMPLAVSLGSGPSMLTDIGTVNPKIHPEDTVLIGIRSVDDTERDLVRQSGVTVFTMRDIDERGMWPVIQEAIHIATRKTTGTHLSFDVDALDPHLAPGVGTPVSGGLSYREAHLLMESIADSGSLCSLEVVEINPIIDTGNTTAELAVELVMSALGKRIL